MNVVPINRQERQQFQQVNQAKNMVDIGDLCSENCIMGSIGIKRDELGNVKPFEAHKQDMFSDKELQCVTNCVKKVFTTEKMFYESLKPRMQYNKITQ